jgi:hypothetical protein
VSTEIKELSDGRYIACNVCEITSFPDLDETGQELGRAADTFAQAIKEFYTLGRSGNVCAELLWITEKAEKQAFRSRIRIFLILRGIGSQQQEIETELNSLQSNFVTLLNSKRYETAVYSGDFPELDLLLGSVDRECAYSVVKREKCSGNSNSPYPYYSCAVLPGSNTDNFSALAASMCQYENCCVSFQLFPTSLTSQEVAFLNEQSALLARFAGGLFVDRQMIKDQAAAEPQRVMEYYSGSAASPLFLYNILALGDRTTTAGLTAKVISLLQSGKKFIASADCGCVDLSGEHIDLRTQFVFYPWNINSKLIHTYRNVTLLKTLRNASVLYRLPYILTAEEAASFFRLPMHEKNMAAIKSSRAAKTVEQFDSAVTSESGIQLGKLKSSGEVIIGCPPNAFTKHALIVGTPGSGKTTFSINLLLQFNKMGIPFLAIEPTKTEYRAMIDAVPDLQIFTPGNNAVSPFIINPFVPPKGIRVEQYIPSLASAFQAAFSMPSPLDILFLQAIRSCYTEHGWKDYSMQGDKDVSAFGLREFIRRFRRLIDTSSYSAEVKGNLRSGGVFRLTNLIEQNSNIYDTINTIPIEDLLKKPTVLELNSIDNVEQKALIMALLLINICVYTKNNQLGDGILKNIILIDEAHVLLAGSSAQKRDEANSQGATIKALQDMIAEIRSYGTGIIIADQSPTKVSREVVANTDIKVSFRLVQSSEKELISDSTNMDEEMEQQLSRLKPGEAYVYYSRLEAPQLVSEDDIREQAGIRLSVPNTEIAEKMKYWDNNKMLLCPYTECRSCKSCKDGCSFKTRSEANYYASKLFDKNSDRIKDAQKLSQYLISMETLIKSALGNTQRDEAIRLVNCCRIQFKKKVEMETSILLSDKEFREIQSRCE